jgi:hypothetical protein
MTNRTYVGVEEAVDMSGLRITISAHLAGTWAQRRERCSIASAGPIFRASRIIVNQQTCTLGTVLI